MSGSYVNGHSVAGLFRLGDTPDVRYLLGTANVSFDQLAHLHTAGVASTAEFRRALGLPTGESA